MKKFFIAALSLIATATVATPTVAATVDISVALGSSSFGVLNRSDSAAITRITFDFNLGGFGLNGFNRTAYFWDGSGPDIDMDKSGLSEVGGGPTGIPLEVYFPTSGPNQFGPDFTFRDFMPVRTTPDIGQLGMSQWEPLTMFIGLSTGDQIILVAGIGSTNGNPTYTQINAGSVLKGGIYTIGFNFTFDEGTMPAPPVPLPASGFAMAGLLAVAAPLIVRRKGARTSAS